MIKVLPALPEKMEGICQEFIRAQARGDTYIYADAEYEEEETNEEAIEVVEETDDETDEETDDDTTVETAEEITQETDEESSEEDVDETEDESEVSRIPKDYSEESGWYDFDCWTCCLK